MVNETPSRGEAPSIPPWDSADFLHCTARISGRTVVEPSPRLAGRRPPAGPGQRANTSPDDSHDKARGGEQKHGYQTSRTPDAGPSSLPQLFFRHAQMSIGALGAG